MLYQITRIDEFAVRRKKRKYLYNYNEIVFIIMNKSDRENPGCLRNLKQRTEIVHPDEQFRLFYAVTSQGL